MSRVHLEDLMVDIGIVEQLFNTLLLGVRDEHLTKMVVAHQPHQFLHPLVVQFVKDIVQ